MEKRNISRRSVLSRCSSVVFDVVHLFEAVAGNAASHFSNLQSFPRKIYGWGLHRVTHPYPKPVFIHPACQWFIYVILPGVWGAWVSECVLTSSPKMSRSFIQNCCCITLQVSYHQGWKTYVKMEGKTNFRGAWNSLMLNLTAPPPYFTTDLRHWVMLIVNCKLFHQKPVLKLCMFISSIYSLMFINCYVSKCICLSTPSDSALQAICPKLEGFLRL